LNKLYVKTAAKFLQLSITLALLTFFPAGTLDYWEGWLFSAVFTLCAMGSALYLAIFDPELLERRLDIGPLAEKEPTQKIIMSFAMTTFMSLIAVPALDHRFGWSEMPTTAVYIGNVLILLSFIAVTRVMQENSFSAATVQIADGQKVISTGPYAVVRHPMYSSVLMMFVGFPLALGSWWGLLVAIPATGAIVWRLSDEERFLRKNLTGYNSYMQTVRFKLLPKIW
jgi:protein-S-isoprenylcysteine O-methyltransferase Ste14